MAERAKRVSHIIVRVAAMVTLIDIGMGVIAGRYYPSYSHALANSWIGMVMTFWAIGASLFLPLYVGFEAWWMRKREEASKGLWIDAAFAVACLLFLSIIVFYAFGHYAMF